MAVSPTASIIYEEFKLYKEKSFPDEHAAPTQQIQKTEWRTHPIFGRDRLDTADAKLKAENIRHVHLRGPDSCWTEDDKELFQWFCSSDTFLIYSHFLYNNTHYYYVIDLLAFNAHIQCFEPRYKDYVLQEARTYKKSIIK